MLAAMLLQEATAVERLQTHDRPMLPGGGGGGSDDYFYLSEKILLE